MSRRSCMLFLVCALPLAAASTSPEVGRVAMARLPLRFEANQGQMNPSIRYAAHAGGYTLQLTDQGASVAMGAGRKVDLQMVNGRAAAIEPLARTATRTDSFVGRSKNDWRTNIPSFSRIKYRGVYPGVDVVYYGTESDLEYDFVVAPGADPNAIRLRFAGAERVSINADGQLAIDAHGRQLLQKSPVIYQNDGGVRRPVSGKYVLLGRNTVGFRLGKYDRSKELTIDPVLLYCSYFGGTGTDKVHSVVVGPAGKLYLVGETDSNQQPVTDNTYTSDNFGLIDIWIAILEPANGSYNLTYFTYLGGTNNDIPMAMDVDDAGVIYLTGSTNSTNFPIVSAFQAEDSTSSTDAFVAKVDPSKSGTDVLVFSSYLGGSGTDVGNGIVAGPNNRIYLIGTTTSQDFPVTDSAFQPVAWGPSDAFLCAIDPGGAGLVYVSYYGGEDAEDGRFIVMGNDGLIYFAVSTSSQNQVWTGFNYRGSPAGSQDMQIGIWDASKAGSESIPYSTTFGGSGNDEIRGMALDRNGRLVLTGYTLSTDFPVTPDAMQSTNNGNGDVFVTVFDPRLNFASALIYSTYLGGKGGDVAYGVAADSAGDIYLTGYTLSTDFPTRNSIMPYNGGTSMFVLKFKPNVPTREAIEFSSYIGNTGTYVGRTMALTDDGRMVVGGFANLGLPVTDGARQPNFGGGDFDGFLMVIQQDAPSPTNRNQTFTIRGRNTRRPANVLPNRQ